MFAKIVAVGDCNTLGANSLRGNSYPERVAEMIGADILNLGYTMATTREGLRLLQDHGKDADCVFIQFGLADSYKTLKYAPYVLYYPDTIFRKYLRSIIKKIKKTCRRTGINDLVGERNVVGPDEYERNIREMIELALPGTVFLIDTIPHLHRQRNAEIRKYNRILDKICALYDSCLKIDLYDVFAHHEEYYQDPTHCSSAGYEYIAGVIGEKISKKSGER